MSNYCHQPIENRQHSYREPEVGERNVRFQERLQEAAKEKVFTVSERKSSISNHASYDGLRKGIDR
eukprot:SAG31_NODE_18224_length_643_cov_0.799632_2_plen_65_part_01